MENLYIGIEIGATKQQAALGIADDDGSGAEIDADIVGRHGKIPPFMLWTPKPPARAETGCPRRAAVRDTDMQAQDCRRRKAVKYTGAGLPQRSGRGPPARPL